MEAADHLPGIAQKGGKLSLSWLFVSTLSMLLPASTTKVMPVKVFAVSATRRMAKKEAQKAVKTTIQLEPTPWVPPLEGGDAARPATRQGWLLSQNGYGVVVVVPVVVVVMRPPLHQALSVGAPGVVV